MFERLDSVALDLPFVNRSITHSYPARLAFMLAVLLVACCILAARALLGRVIPASRGKVNRR